MTSDDKTRIAPDAGVRPGVQLNGIYEIDEHIATGGMGEVYRGHNIQTGDPVAIKVVLREFARDQAILALFRKEASILNHLSHDAIVRYHVFTIDPAIGRPYLAMEFVDGQSLGERIRKGPLDPREARKMLARVASGLSVAHEAGVIHRDLSPDNIVLPGGNVEKTKIIDFGIARSTNVGGGTLLGGSFAGKYSFVSPEQVGLFGGEVTERSDIYSLGLVLAAALRGRQFDMGSSPVEVIEKRRAVPDLGGIDGDIRPLLESMLQPDPADRPQSATEIVEWLRETSGATAPPPAKPAASELSWRPPGSATAPGTPRSAPPPPESLLPRDAPWRNAQRSAKPAPAPTPPSPADTRREPSGRGGLVAALALAALVVAGGGAYFSGALDGLLGGGQGQPGEGGKPALEPSPRPPADGSTKNVAPAPSGQAGTKPSAKPAEPPREAAAKPAPVPASAADWLKAFDGGPCFYAASADIGAQNPRIEGFATFRAPFDKLGRDFSSAFGRTATLDPRIIERDQCPVADFLEALRPDAATSPGLELSKDRLKVGDSLQGKLTGAGKRDVNLLLIGKDGVVYNFASLLKRTDTGEATFSMKLFPLSDQEAGEPEPHLIMALASDGGIRAADIRDPELASDLFPKIRREIEARPGMPGIAVGYFLFDR
ncbi:serine/threonine-protein kinase [Mesorhizobium sp. CC13]|uniref:serine/threonine-protein kinase n=1 Tax=Mesorhizobium sp. CC13 TaxID=3029194 RepID=UPI0032646F81